MTRIVFYHLAICLFVFALIGGCGEQTIPEPKADWNPDNPVFAQVVDYQIDQEYFDQMRVLLKKEGKPDYQLPEEYPRLLNDMIIQEIYTHEGYAREYDRHGSFSSMMDIGKNRLLIDFYKEKMLKNFTPDPKRGDVKKQQDAFIDSRIAEIAKRFGVKYHLERLKLGQETSVDPVVETGVMSWSFNDFARLAVEAGRRKDLDTYEDRVNALKSMIENRLLQDDAIAENLHKDPVYLKRKKYMKRYLMSRYARSQIIGDDISATSREAKIYFQKHIDEFKSKTGKKVDYYEVEDQVVELATVDKRENILNQLSQALAQSRCRVYVFEDNCLKVWPKWPETEMRKFRRIRD